jgi:hypothetical protein
MLVREKDKVRQSADANTNTNPRKKVTFDLDWQTVSLDVSR